MPYTVSTPRPRECLSSKHYCRRSKYYVEPISYLPVLIRLLLMKLMQVASRMATTMMAAMELAAMIPT